MGFNGHYEGWRNSRISKIISLFSEDFFKNKTILELGCGFGDIGGVFKDLGSNVTFADGKLAHVNRTKEKFPDCEVILLDQDTSWNLDRKFDIIIHWGVLYHLNDWKRDILTALNHSNLIFLESEVSDSDSDNFELKVNEPNFFDQAVNGIGSRPSAGYIEKIVKSTGASIIRYDDTSLNSDFHTYDWTSVNSGTWRNGLRRFWVIQK